MIQDTKPVMPRAKTRATRMMEQQQKVHIPMAEEIKENFELVHDNDVQ